jgi:hypothetical protein
MRGVTVRLMIQRSELTADWHPALFWSFVGLFWLFAIVMIGVTLRAILRQQKSILPSLGHKRPRSLGELWYQVILPSLRSDRDKR